MKWVVLAAMIYANPANAAVKCEPHDYWRSVIPAMHRLTSGAADRFSVLYDIISKTSSKSKRAVYFYDNATDDETYYIVVYKDKSCGFTATGHSRKALIDSVNNDETF